MTTPLFSHEKDIPESLGSRDIGLARVELEYLGEGLSGDFHEDNPDDAPRVRFTVEVWDAGFMEWVQVENGSYCTDIDPLKLTQGQLDRVLTILAEALLEPALRGESIKQEAARLSWLNNDDLNA